MSQLDCFSLSRKLDGLSDPSYEAIERYLRYLQSRNYADGTLKVVVCCLRRFLLHQPEFRRRQLAADLSLTSSTEVENFVSSASQSGLSPSTINNTLSLLVPLFDFFIDEELIANQPVRRKHRVFAPQHLPKPMVEDDLKRFFRVIDKVPDRLMFLLMLRCGLRVSEVAHLQWTDLDSVSGTVRINNSKGQVDRVLYLSPDVVQTLSLWQLAQTTTASSWLFPSDLLLNQPLTIKTIYRRMMRYLEKAEVGRHYSPHNLRHTFATQLLNAGCQLEVLKELMGHKSLSMTLCYTELYESTKRRQYDRAMERIEAKQTDLFAAPQRTAAAGTKGDTGK